MVYANARERKVILVITEPNALISLNVNVNVELWITLCSTHTN